MSNQNAKAWERELIDCLDESSLGIRMTQAIRLMPKEHQIDFILRYGLGLSIIPCIAIYLLLWKVMPPPTWGLLVQVVIAFGIPAIIAPIVMPKLVKYFRVVLIRDFEQRVPIAAVIGALHKGGKAVPSEVQQLIQSIQASRSLPWKPHTSQQIILYFRAVDYAANLARQRVH
ncbi:MAG TPA: hypothetical protein VGV16_00530 [Gammaproteobacteria bacterium]|nr:hypothetical protein [Gammaproteobacteria bacterium]